MDHNSEALLMAAFQMRLGDDFLIMHSFPWLFPGREDIDAPAREGEADFVLLHREKGMLVIEAKGGVVALRDRRWRRVLEDGRLKDIRDPAQQVRRAERALRKRLEIVCGDSVVRKIRFATAVAFPHCVFRDEPPPDLPARTIITMDDLAGVEMAIERVFGAFGAPKGPLTGTEFEEVRRALAPEFALYEPLKLDVDAAGKILAQLTRQQTQVLKGFSSNQRAIVHGVAGSGKTMLALERARRFARDGHATLFTCYNVELAKWVAEQIAPDRYEVGSLTVRHFHGLAADVLKMAGLPLEPTGDAAKYWDEMVPDMMATAAITIYGDKSPFDALVVDEAQDFSPGWWDSLQYLTGLNDRVPTWAFLDRDQSLRRDPVDPPLKGAVVLELGINCRNTRRIVAFAQNAAHILTEPSELAPLGRPPRMIVAPSQGAIAGLVQNEIRRLLEDHRLRPDQIVLIGPAGWKNGCLGRWSSIAGAKLTDSAEDWRLGGVILSTTTRRFKGLEADVMILYDLHGIGPLFTKTDLYVALTRARSHIVLVTQSSEFANQLQAAVVAVAAIGQGAELA